MQDSEMNDSDWSSFPPGGSAVVFGAGGGIGGALAGRLGQSRHFDRVLAFSRTSTPALDLLNEKSVAEAAGFAAAQGDLRLVVVATGFLHAAKQPPEKTWRDIDPEHMAHALAVNTIGPALVMKHVLPHLPRKGKAVFAVLSARVGSIGDNRLGGWYSYRASKAALNQLMRTAAIELKRRQPAAICVALHPGTVDTPLSRPFSKTDLDVQSPSLAAERLLAVMARLNPSDSGRFFDHRGESVRW